MQKNYGCYGIRRKKTITSKKGFSIMEVKDIRKNSRKTKNTKENLRSTMEAEKNKTSVI